MSLDYHYFLFYKFLHQGGTLMKVLKGGALTVVPKFSGQVEQKWVKYLKAVENIDEYEQISLLITCATKLHIDIIGLP